MATIVEMINPLTGLPEQVDKLDHTAQEIDDAVDLAPQLSNPNLLDNWYFGNPVNQRGQTSYTGSGYGIDRWALSVNRPGSFLLHSSDNYSADVKGTFYQRIENKRFIVGAKYTLSVLRGLIASPTLYHETFTLTESVGWKSRFNVNGGTFGFYYDQNISDIQFDLDDLKTIIAAKLELGSQQTLAHRDENGVWVPNEIPDYGEQLARCQRHCIEIVPAVSNDYGAIGSGSAVFTDRVYVCVPLPVTMRAQPTVSYTGNWKLVSGVVAADGFDVNWLAVDKISNNSVTLNVTTANQVLTVGKTYHLWRTPASKNSMLFSADL